MAIALGLAVAATYGAADFFGGIAAKRTTNWSVVVIVQAVGVVMLAALVGIDGVPWPAASDLVFGAVASLAGCLGVGLLYLGLARGPMGVVAPITAVGSAVVPVAYGLLTGERPAVIALGGVVLAIVAVVFIARNPPEHGVDEPVVAARSTVLVAVGSGVCFGAFFILIDQTNSDSGFWPLLSGRVVSLPLLVVLLAMFRRQIVPTRESLNAGVTSGILDTTANAFFIVAVREGLISLVAPIAALYPATTVLMARIVLQERVHRLQLLGLVLALFGVMLISIG